MPQPVITNTPFQDSPQQIAWVPDVSPVIQPNLTEPTANMSNDLHGNIDVADLAISTAGNYHMALRDLMYDVYLPANPLVKTWFSTTSPPVVVQQLANGVVAMGNMSFTQRPMLCVAGGATLNAIPVGDRDGARQQVFRNFGNVILVKAGNPRHIDNIFDLGKSNVRVVTPHNTLEPEAFNNYAGSIYNIALNMSSDEDAMDLFNEIFNAHNQDHKHKWLAGTRIHHREVPWSVAYGNADAALIFYHLAKYCVDNFPGLFEFIPLGGTVTAPMPVTGNQVATQFVQKLTGPWTAQQVLNRDAFVAELLGTNFDPILTLHGLRR